jgi:hypothetical protein
MEQLNTATVNKPAAPGRLWFRLGMAVNLLGLVLYGIQFFALKQIVMPWYVLVLATLGVLMMAAPVWQQPSWSRLLGLGLFLLLTVFDWYFLVFFSRLPPYTGPAQTDHKFPAFTTTLADGSPFTEQDLQQGIPTVVLFFRGRW